MPSHISIHPYQAELRELWDKLVRESSNGTFLHQRGFMEYHSDRFRDQSFLCMKDEQPLALLPLEGEEEKLYSHRGLTYAGWIFKRGLNGEEKKEILEASLEELRKRGVKELAVKTVPSFFCTETQNPYHHYLAEIGGEISQVNEFYYTPLPIKIQDRGKRWGARKAFKNGVEIRPASELSDFWQEVLIPCLRERHATSPVHSLEEIQLLKSRFPKEIILWVACLDEELLAGSLLFLIGDTIHCQYIASTPKGRTLRSLDALMSHLMEKEFADKKGFSLGTAQDSKSGKPDQGLVQWKKSLGALPIPVPVYHFKLSN
ncbi:GNAT family N-acetyltransferase [Algoriphagus sp. CAU 1675]|uniref:GNAT family N-acetyltransferase n=1 Tax=Algoriphagus sp. CAU 1675 TaxID=3032597 RepID=UPI0023DAFD78|nr:GNAT family N-acetyltransferase [Algoriphagus sp. CAU 1675]MDF2159415.1 GNAT family N-acetyltransferase [Algoriphagus sp. CAU 1675]